MVVIEPRLNVLAERAKREKITNYNANKIWSEKYKPAISNLVGFYSKHQTLQNAVAFEVVSKKICKLLPY